MPPEISNSYLIEKLQEAGEVLGRTPTTSSIDSLKGFPAHRTYSLHFGSWNKALQVAGFRINQERNVVSEVRRMSEAEVAFVAGVFDADGHISIRYVPQRKCYDCKCAVANNNLDLLYRLQKLVNGGRIICHTLADERKHHAPQYLLQFRISEEKDLLPQLLPWLVVKRDNAVNLLTYLRRKK